MTVAELVALLQQFPPETPIEIDSTDGPEYGWIDVGPGMGNGRPPFRGALAQIQTEGLVR